MKALASQEPNQTLIEELRRPQVTARIVYHCNECDPFGPLFGDASGSHPRKAVFETVPCNCETCASCYADVVMTEYDRCPVCSAYRQNKQGVSRSLNKLRGQSATDRLIAGLDRDAQDAAGRIKGVLSLTGVNLTESDVVRICAQLRAELASFLIKAEAELNQEWFNMIAAHQVRN